MLILYFLQDVQTSLYHGIYGECPTLEGGMSWGGNCPGKINRGKCPYTAYRRRHRSASTTASLVPRKHRQTIGDDHAFPVAAAQCTRLEQSFIVTLSPTSLSPFKRNLKTELFA